MSDVSTKPDYEKTYDEFWRELVERPDGTLDRDKVMRELHDYREILDDLPALYDDITGGRITKPNTAAHHVVAAVQERTRQAEAIRAAEELEDVLDSDLSSDEIRAKVAELRAEATS